MNSPVDPIIELFAQSLADEARKISLNFFRREIIVTKKSDGTSVTEADLLVESKLRQMISERFPDHNIYGEEQHLLDRKSDWTWVIDPIDGTKSFITGQPTFGCLIGLLNLDKPVLGIIEMPALKERWMGSVGKTTTFNGIGCKTSSVYSLAESTLTATSPDMFNTQEWAVFSKLSSAVKFRFFGNDCYSYALLSLGFIDLVMEADLGLYDFLPLVPIIIGAGGSITDWQGKELTFKSGSQVLASANPALHSQALALINQV